MSKTTFSDNAPDSEANTRANNECARADEAVRQLGAMKARIRHFDAYTESVKFCVEEQYAVAWMNNWVDYLLQGSIDGVIVPTEIVNDGDAEVIVVDNDVVAEFEAPPAAVDFERDAEECDTVVENGIDTPPDQAG